MTTTTISRLDRFTGIFTDWRLTIIGLVFIFCLPVLICFAFDVHLSVSILHMWKKYNDLVSQCDHNHCVYNPTDVGTIYISSFLLSCCVMAIFNCVLLLQKALKVNNAVIIAPFIASVMLILSNYSLLNSPIGRDPNPYFVLGNYVDKSPPYILFHSFIAIFSCSFVWLLCGFGNSARNYKVDLPFSDRI